MSAIKHAIKRTDAVKLINALRLELASSKEKIRLAESRAYRDKLQDQLIANLESILKDDYGIEPARPCPGQAHTPGGAMQDNCGVCMHTPFRWGFVGNFFKIT